VRGQGREDGHLQPPVPPWEATEQPPFVEEIRKAGDGDLQLITLGWDREDRELKARYAEAHKFFAHCEQARMGAEKQFRAAAEWYEKLHGQPAPGKTHRGFLFYFVIAVLISVFEIPINLSFFRMFGESEALTIVATVGLAFSLMFCAHFLGVMLKQGEFASRVRRVFVGAMIAVPLVLIGGVASLRVSYLHQVDETARNVSALVLLTVSAALNLLMVVVATAAAYVLHEEGRAELDAARRALRRLTHAKEQAERSLTKLEEQRRKVFDDFKTQAQHIKDVAEGLIEAYRTANLAARADRGESRSGAYPASYLQEVKVQIPKPLQAADPPPLGPAGAAAARGPDGGSG
jgi:uncharacterized membrane protein